MNKVRCQEIWFYMSKYLHKQRVHKSAKNPSLISIMRNFCTSKHALERRLSKHTRTVITFCLIRLGIIVLVCTQSIACNQGGSRRL
ncbi:hypothetical protein CPB83DRAFT_845235 [Crepidotus variabilis]|uniref:Uncharacterized protein n=1 Tax=Crepidotus variabilis TaxID=179855 RepID=A0A9P6EQS1_9AGAR|nr:hypothetical protein CPB83DRAFT_845235 [Crepidotus variabilis]